MRGRGKDSYHRRCENSNEVPRVGLDYMFLTEKGVTHLRKEAEEAAAETGAEYLTALVMKDFMTESIFAYPVEGKGTQKAPWLVRMIVEDLKTCGLDNCILVVKTDNEPAIVEVQEEIAATRRAEGAK